MRLIYSLLSYCIAPLLPLYLKKRGTKNPDYLLNWHERFGLKLVNPSSKPIIWLHSVSVGETRAMQKLVELLSLDYPNYQLLVTTMTPTGRATALSLYPQAIVHYVPYDLSFCVQRFYANFKPALGIIFETEIWPNLLHFARERAVPLYLVNARLSNKSYLGYKRFKWAMLPILNCLEQILCQDQSSADNFAKLGYRGKLEVVGNTKYDLVLSSNVAKITHELKSIIGEQRKVINFASTREGEEELFIQHIDFNPNFLYLIIPRHPERFVVLENLLKKAGISYQKRSTQQMVMPDTQVLIGDSMGEMLAYYSVSYLTIMGGSFQDFGGQNPLESLFVQTPVILGPSIFNFTAVVENAVAAGCALQVSALEELNTLLNAQNLSEIHQTLQPKCLSFIARYQGASQIIVDKLALASK